MENQTRRNVLMEKEMNVDGVRLAETKEIESGQAQEILTHSRWIDYKMCSVKRIIFDGEVQEVTVDTNLAEDKIEAFMQEWEEKWEPTATPANFDGLVQQYFNNFFNFL